MTTTDTVAEHWGAGDVYGLILAALERMSIPLDGLTIEALGPIDHFHARGFPATVELADKLPILRGQHILDIGCGLGGPARYIAQRFGCRVSGIDITQSFVETANRLTDLLGLQTQVSVELGDGQCLPYSDARFDGAYTQHVTMNVADRRAFFAEAFRVLRPGAFFALTEQCLGPAGDPYHPVPWSEDGSGAYLITADETRELLEDIGFEQIGIDTPGAKYLTGYQRMVARAEAGALPPFGVHLLMGDTAVEKMRNAARNIEEARTFPIQLICRKPPSSS